MPYTAYKFRLYPTAAQSAALDNQLETLRQVYNAALSWWRDAYQYERSGRGQVIPRRAKSDGGERKCGLVESLYPVISGLRNSQLEAQKNGEPGPHWLTQVSAVSMRDTLTRVEKAFQGFYQRLARGSKKPGYPRLKRDGRLRSIPFNNYGSGATLLNASSRKVAGNSGESLGGFRLGLFAVGRVKVKMHRPVVGTIKTVTVTRETDGKWYAILVCERPETLVDRKVGRAVGVDVGLAQFFTTSDGEQVGNPRFLQATLPELRRLQRSSSRKMAEAKRAKRRFHECRNLQKSLLDVARLVVRVGNQRKEFHHQQAKRLIDRHATVCVERLNVQGMVRNGKLSRAISDAGWRTFVERLKQHAAKAGASVIEVDAAYTSQTCSACGHCEADNRPSQAVFRCVACGLAENADVNAAKNILARGLDGAGSVPARLNVAPLPPGSSGGMGERAGRSLKSPKRFRKPRR
jgi:putative transposase